MVAVTTGEQEPVKAVAGTSFKVYPNPTTGSFILEFTGKAPSGKIEVAIYSMHGEKLSTNVMTAERSHIFSLSDKPAGMYVVHVLAGGKAGMVKIIKQ